MFTFCEYFSSSFLSQLWSLFRESLPKKLSFTQTRIWRNWVFLNQGCLSGCPQVAMFPALPSVLHRYNFPVCYVRLQKYGTLWVKRHWACVFWAKSSSRGGGFSIDTNSHAPRTLCCDAKQRMWIESHDTLCWNSIEWHSLLGTHHHHHSFLICRTNTWKSTNQHSCALMLGLHYSQVITDRPEAVESDHQDRMKHCKAPITPQLVPSHFCPRVCTAISAFVQLRVIRSSRNFNTVTCGRLSRLSFGLAGWKVNTNSFVLKCQKVLSPSNLWTMRPFLASPLFWIMLAEERTKISAALKPRKLREIAERCFRRKAKNMLLSTRTDSLCVLLPNQLKYFCMERFCVNMYDSQWKPIFFPAELDLVQLVSTSTTHFMWQATSTWKDSLQTLGPVQV